MVRCVALLCCVALGAGFVPAPARARKRLASSRRAGDDDDFLSKLGKSFDDTVKGAQDAVAEVAGEVTNAAVKGVTGLDANAMEQKMKDGTLDFDDFLAQSKAMGRASQMAGAANAMGMTNSIGEMEAAKDKMAQRSKLVEAMTTIERKTPALFVGTDADAQERKQRVADSCGVDAEEVQKFINEFVLMRSAAMKFSSGMDQEQIKFEMAKEQRDMGDPISRRARRMLDRKDKSQGKKKKSGRKGSVGRGFS